MGKFCKGVACFPVAQLDGDLYETSRWSIPYSEGERGRVKPRRAGMFHGTNKQLKYALHRVCKTEIKQHTPATTRKTLSYRRRAVL